MSVNATSKAPHIHRCNRGEASICTRGRIITQTVTVDDLLHRRSFNLEEQLKRRNLHMSRRIITPFAFERCSRRSFVLLMPVDTPHGRRIPLWIPVGEVDLCNTAWPNKPRVSRCPDVPQSAHQGYADTKASTWCALSVSLSLIDWVRIRTYVHGVTDPAYLHHRAMCESCTMGAGPAHGSCHTITQRPE